MDNKTIIKEEGKPCSLVLKNNFIYKHIIYQVKDGSVQFRDKFGVLQKIEPSFVSMISLDLDDEVIENDD